MTNQISGDELEILAQIDRHMQEKKAVKLFNSFKGVPVTCEAYVSLISQGYVATNVDPHQAVCIALEKRTLLQSEYLTSLVNAQAVTVTVGTCEVVLNRFTYAPTTAGKRMTLRVQPRETIQMELQYGGDVVVAKMADLSPKGVGVYSFGTLTNTRMEYKTGETVKISMRLPPEGHVLQMDGKISNINRERGTFMFRVGIQIKPDRSIEPFIARYISSRQEEIIAELEQLHESMSS